MKKNLVVAQYACKTAALDGVRVNVRVVDYYLNHPLEALNTNGVAAMSRIAELCEVWNGDVDAIEFEDEGVTITISARENARSQSFDSYFHDSLEDLEELGLGVFI